MPNINLAPTNWAAQQEDIARRRKMAEMLQQQSMAPVERFSTNGIEAPISWTQGLAKMLQAYQGGQGQRSATEDQKALGERYSSEGAQTMAKMLAHYRGTPASTEIMPMDEQANDGMGAANQQINIPAQPGNLDAAIATGATHPMTEGFSKALATQLFKSPESAFSKIDPKDFTPESVATFAKTGKHADLVPRDKIVADNTGAGLTYRTEYSPKPISERSLSVSPNTAFTQANENARFGAVSGNTRFAQGQENLRHVTPTGSTTATLNQAANIPLQQGIASAHALGTEVGKAQGEMQVDPAKAAFGARKILEAVNYDPKTNTDDVTKLIEGSTSGIIQRGAAEAKGAITGTGTSGMERIGRLQVMANKITMDLMGGKLGTGISNADRDFVIGQLGDVGNPHKTDNERAAAWDQAIGRLKKLASVQMNRRASDQPGAVIDFNQLPR